MPDQAAGHRYFIIDQAVLLIFINSHPCTLAIERKAGAPLESHADIWTLRLKLSQWPKFAFTQIHAREFAGIAVGTCVHSEYSTCMLHLLYLLLLTPVDLYVDLGL